MKTSRKNHLDHVFYAEQRIWPKKSLSMLNDYPDNSRHNMTKNLQNSKFYFFESDLKTGKKHL